MYRRMVAGRPRSHPDDTWQERLLTSNRGLRAALLGYRDGAKVFSGSRFTGIEHAVEMEANLRLFTAAGFTLAQAVRATSTTYLLHPRFRHRGTGRRAAAGRAPRGLRRRGTRPPDGRLSLVGAAGAEIFENYDEHFEEGLDLVIAGIEARYGVR